MQLLQGRVAFTNILVSSLFADAAVAAATDKSEPTQLPISNVKVSTVRLSYICIFLLIFDISIQLIHTTNLFAYIPIECAPKVCGGQHEHNQTHWREFFAIMEPLQNQCLASGRQLVSVLGDIRSADNQGPPTRRQLYAQHRALSRALMDADLQNLRRKGQNTITRLQELEQCISGHEVNRHSLATNSKPSEPSTASQNDHSMPFNQLTCNNKPSQTHVANRLYELVTIFVEVDRAARRLEQLTEQRRERLREITRQRALEEEINEVSI